MLFIIVLSIMFGAAITTLVQQWGRYIEEKRKVPSNSIAKFAILDASLQQSLKTRNIN